MYNWLTYCKCWAGSGTANRNVDALLPTGVVLSADVPLPRNQIIISVFLRVELAGPALLHLENWQGEWSSQKEGVDTERTFPWLSLNSELDRPFSFCHVKVMTDINMDYCTSVVSSVVPIVSEWIHAFFKYSHWHINSIEALKEEKKSNILKIRNIEFCLVMRTISTSVMDLAPPMIRWMERWLCVLLKVTTLASYPMGSTDHLLNLIKASKTMK